MLKQIQRDFIPEKVKKAVKSRCNLLLLLSKVDFSQCWISWMDENHQRNAKNGSKNGSSNVINKAVNPHFPAFFVVNGS